MATTLTVILGRVRIKLQETTADFWTDAEILAELNHAIADLQKAINALYEDYYFTTDTTNCSIAAGASTVTGVPADLMIVRGLEPRTPSSYPDLVFQFKKFTDAAFMAARVLAAQDPTQIPVILVAQTGPAGPVAAPTLNIAPVLTSAMNLRLSYIPNLAVKVGADNNPIPGNSDKALEAYAIAYCRARVREDQVPDPDWLALYATEKANLVIALEPRQEQDDIVTEAVFQDLW